MISFRPIASKSNKLRMAGAQHPIRQVGDIRATARRAEMYSPRLFKRAALQSPKDCELRALLGEASDALFLFKGHHRNYSKLWESMRLLAANYQHNLFLKTPCRTDKARAYAAGAQGYLNQGSDGDESVDEVVRRSAQIKGCCSDLRFPGGLKFER